MTLLEFDLDHAPARPGAPAPGPAGRRLPLLLGALVVAAVAGAVLRTVSFGHAEPPAAPVVAVLSADGLTLAPDPTLSLRLEVAAEAGDIEVQRVDLRGGGSGDVSIRLGAQIRSGRSAGFDLETTLVCRPLGNPDLTGTVRVLDVGAELARDVPLVTTGALHGDGGGCGLTAAGLPTGWPDPVPVSDVRVVGEVLALRLDDLGAGRVQGVSVEGTVLSPAPGARPDDELALLPPTLDCRPDTRPALATGLQLLVAAPDGLSTRYAPVGPELARWLRSARAGQCDRRSGTGGG